MKFPASRGVFSLSLSCTISKNDVSVNSGNLIACVACRFLSHLNALRKLRGRDNERQNPRGAWATKLHRLAIVTLCLCFKTSLCAKPERDSRETKFSIPQGISHWVICYIAKRNKRKFWKTRWDSSDNIIPIHLSSRATAVNISRVTVNCIHGIPAPDPVRTS